MTEPVLIGILSAQAAKGKKAFSFEYDKQWLQSKFQNLLDPDIQFYSGPQYPHNKENLGIFLDSMPDTWGRTLMKRKAAIEAREKNKKPSTLYDKILAFFSFPRPKICHQFSLFHNGINSQFLLIRRIAIFVQGPAHEHH